VTGLEDASTRETVNSLGSTYAGQIKLADADADLAPTFRLQGRLKKAEELAMELIELTKRASSEEYLDTVTSLTNLTSTYIDQ
jgi:hypothetical protein